VGSAALVFLMSAVLLSRRAGPQTQVPLPGDLAKLEPQVRAYLTAKIAWVRGEPNDPNRQATLGVVYGANGLWNEARMAFQNASKLNPREPLALLYVGIATEEVGDIEGALKVFGRVTTQFPDFPQGFYHFGDALLRAGRVNEADAAFQRLIVLAPNEWRGYAGLGDVRLRTANYAEAAKLLRKAIDLGPDAKRAHYLLGLAYRGLNRQADAKLELAIGINQPGDRMDDAWSVSASQHMKLLPDQMEMASEFSQRGQPSRAVKILSEAFAYQPENQTLANALAIALNRSGRPGEARDLLLKVIQKDEHCVPAFVTISYSCTELGLTGESLKYADRAIELGPNLAQSYLAKANALLASEHDVEAYSALESAARCDPQNAQIQVEMGDVSSLNLQRTEEAIGHYKKATELNPALLSAYARLAELCIHTRQFNDAADALKIMRLLSPKAPELAALELELRQSDQSGNPK
jgi:tetratricopeptide (TPR) repeat protein